MSKQQSQVATFALPVAGSDSSEGSAFLKKSIYHWPLYAVAVIAALVLGFFYLKVTSPVYPVLATLEFKAPTASSASLTVNQNTTEQELDPINKPIIVENEIEVMQSKKLIYQVVKELQLWVNYTEKKGLQSVDLYKRTPVKFSYIKESGEVAPNGRALKVTLTNSSNFAVKDTDGVIKTYAYNTPIKSVFGTWQLAPTAELASHIGKTINISIMDPDLVSDVYQKKIKVELENKDAPFVNLSTTDVVPERGKDVLNSLMSLYLQSAIEDKNRLSQKTLKFIDFRLDSLKSELDSVERQIESYKKRNGITDLIAQAQSYRDINQANIKSLNEVDVQLGIINSVEKYLNAAAGTDKLPVGVSSLNDAGIISIYDKLTELQLQKEELLSTTPSTNPAVSAIQSRIDLLKNDFKDRISVLKETLLAQKRQYQALGNNVNQFLSNVPSNDREYNILTRYQESKVNIYKFLLEKHEQVALRYASSISEAEVVDDAHAGQVKWPLGSFVYLAALLVGLGIAAGILYLREMMNEFILSRKQIEDATEVPILGELSYQETDNQIVVSEGRSKLAIGEQFRVLRTNLYHLHNNNDSGRVTLFTSSVSGEGKSFVSSNMAVTLAYAGRKTIILEMDLRKPKVSVNFGLSSEHIGISDYLAEKTTDLSKIIQSSGIPGLDVLGCGTIQPNPSELLEKEKLDELINKLKESYDEIIIDSPPIHLVTDALIIARVADVSLYVIRQGYTHKYELEFITEINEAQRFPKFTIIFNGIKRGTSTYGGGYGYGYGYSYGYSNNYYNSYSGKEKRTFGDIVKGILSRF